MKSWVWFLFGGVLLSGLVAVLMINISPKAVRLVKPSYFDTPEDIGALIWSRYNGRFASEPALVIGVQPGSVTQERVAKGFLDAASAAGFQFERRLTEARLDLNILSKDNPWTKVNLQKSDELLVKHLQTQGSVFVLPSTLTSHVIGGTPVAIAEKKVGEKVLTISLVNFTTSMDALNGLQPGCDGKAVFGEKTMAALGCAVRRKSISTFRKKLDRSRYVMAMEQTGEKDYLVYISRPKAQVN